MRSVNKVILIGNLVKDPEMKDAGLNQKLCTFVLATNREWFTGEAGGKERKSLPEFHNLTAWGNMATKCHKFLRKGKLVYVEGYLKTRKFVNDDGSKSYRTEVVAYNMIMLDKRSDAPNGGEDDYTDEPIDRDLEESLNAEAVPEMVTSMGLGIDDTNESVF